MAREEDRELDTVALEGAPDDPDAAPSLSRRASASIETPEPQAPERFADPLDPSLEGWPDDEEPIAPAELVTAAEGLESRVLLARARRSLLGWTEQEPVAVGRYRIVERIGTGGMGVVYAAHDDELDRPVAIKILRNDKTQGSAGRQRLLREAQAIAKLSHPNVVHVYEVGQERDQVFMAMELVRGVTLRAWRDAQPRPWHEILAMFLRAGEGLAAAHAEGIVHRDFKPDNVLVGRDDRPRVLDFGLARAAAEAIHTTNVLPPSSSGSGQAPSASASSLRDFDITRTGTVVGTPAYMAPEQLELAEPDARSDQFSFCVALFEALYGRRPFGGSTYTELAANLRRRTPQQALPKRRNVPRAIEAAVLRGLSREPDARWPTMSALLSALRKAADAPQGRTRSWLAGGVLSAAIAAAAAATLLRDQGEAAPTPTQAPTATQDATDPWAEVVAASNLPPTIAQPLQGDPTALTLHRLRNGLSIYVVNRPTEPFVSSAIIIRAGSKEEGEQHQGIAPLVMHTVMQGTERLGVIDPSLERPQLVLQHALLEKLPRVDDVRARDVMLRAISAAERSAATVLGGQEFFGAASALGAREPGVFNGHGTQILIDVPRHRFGAWVSLTAEALRRPVFRNFLGTVAQELELGSWRAEGSRADLELFRALRDATGIVFDHEAAIAELSRIPYAEARQFHADYYRPNNIAFVLVGDITAEEALPLFEQQFGDWEPAPIPRSSTVERPLTAPRTVIQIEDSGPPRAELAWAMPVPGTPEHADLLALNDALPGPGGLLGTAIDAAGMSGGSYAAPMRDFRVAVFPGPGQTLREAETLAFDALKRVADDRVSDEAWARALARASLERNAWARSTPMLIERIADSYLDARPWADVAHELAGPPATRARMIGAAKRLVSQGYVVVHKDAGKPWRLEVPKLPVERRKPTFGQHSPFVQSLLDAPATPMEPRFLVEGSHYRSRAYGKGRLITTAADGPLYRAVWIFPLGTAEDAWVCDAFQAALHRLPVDDVDVWVDCSTADTRVILLGNAADRAVSMPKLTSWLLETPLDSAHARDWAELAVQWRSDYRNDVIALEHAFHAWALRGEYGLDAQLPDDDAMRRDAVRELPRALAAARARDPDVLYVGPDVDGFIAGLPRPRGQRGGPLPQRRYRELESPTVFVLHDPHRQDASVRVAVPWLARTTRDALVGRIHAHTAWMNSFGIDPRLEAQWLEYDVRWSPTDPLAVGVGYRAEDEDVAFAIRTALTALRARPQAKQFDEARSFLEVSYRGYRVPQRRVPEHVRSWGPDASDPRVAQWLALPGLAMDDIDEYFARVDATTPVISVVVNLDRFDTATLAEFGKVIVLRDHGLLRDPMLTELGADAPMQRINE